MRLGILGPASDDLDALARAAELLLNKHKVVRAIYLGPDDALERMVAAWAESLVGGDPSDEGIWERAIGVAASGTSQDIDAFLAAERARLRLKSLEALPSDGLRTVEMFGERVALFVYDKALLDEEDIFSATFLVYGKSQDPLIKKIGTRWFLTPGSIGSSAGGALVLDDEGDEVQATVLDGEGKATMTETLAAARGAKLRVQGDR
jgi:hypothetical protein